MTSDFTGNSTERNFISVTQLAGSMSCSAKVMLRSECHRSDGTSQLNLQCFVNGSKVVIPLGIWIHPKYYNKKQREVRGHDRANDINMDLRKQIARANDIFINYRLSGQQLTGAIFRAEFSNGDSRVDFVKFYESKLAHRKKVIEHGTYKNHLRTLRRLREFKSVIRFGDLSVEFLENFSFFLKTKHGNGPNTIWAELKNVRTYIRMADACGIRLNNPFARFSLKWHQTVRAHLNEDEVALLYRYFKNTDNVAHKRTLRVFLFSCFTGLRISDVRLIEREMIEGNLLTLRPKKTKSKLVMVALNDAALSLIPPVLSGRLFEMPPDQRVNTNLKLICKRNSITKHVTFHVARHTYATLFLKLGGKVEVLQSLLGHSSVTTTMIYAHIVNEEKLKQVKFLDSILVNETQTSLQIEKPASNGGFSPKKNIETLSAQ